MLNSHEISMKKTWDVTLHWPTIEILQYATSWRHHCFTRTITGSCVSLRENQTFIIESIKRTYKKVKIYVNIVSLPGSIYELLPAFFYVFLWLLHAINPLPLFNVGLCRDEDASTLLDIHHLMKICVWRRENESFTIPTLNRGEGLRLRSCYDHEYVNASSYNRS